jgi:NhaP-type Na+/H+ or K+/H+ antiporter
VINHLFLNILQWLGEVICYSVILAVIVGCAIGYCAKYVFKVCLKKKLMDKPSFMAFLVCLAICTGAICDFFTISNYIAVCCAGVVITWDDFFNKESENTHAQEVLDMLMNWAFFIFFGSSIKWEAFNNGYLSLWRLFLVTALIFVFRRLPAVLVFRNWITPIRFFKESIYVGWFGPVGVGAMWYTSLAIQRLGIEPFEHVGDEKKENDLFNMYYYSIMFIVFLSIILHGITVPIAHMTLTYTTRSFHKKDNDVAWPKNMPIDGNVISGPITNLDSNAILKKKDENEAADNVEESEKVANITPVQGNDVNIDIEEINKKYQEKDSEQKLVKDDE